MSCVHVRFLQTTIWDAFTQHSCVNAFLQVRSKAAYMWFFSKQNKQFTSINSNWFRCTCIFWNDYQFRRVKFRSKAAIVFVVHVYFYVHWNWNTVYFSEYQMQTNNCCNLIACIFPRTLKRSIFLGIPNLHYMQSNNINLPKRVHTTAMTGTYSGHASHGSERSRLLKS